MLSKSKHKEIYKILNNPDIPNYSAYIHTISPDGKVTAEYIDICDDVKSSIGNEDVVIIQCGSEKIILNAGTNRRDIRSKLKEFRKKYISTLQPMFSCSGKNMRGEWIRSFDFALGVEDTDLLISRSHPQFGNLKLEVENKLPLTLPLGEHTMDRKPKEEITVEDIGWVLKQMGFIYVGSRTFIKSNISEDSVDTLILPSDKSMRDFFSRETSPKTEDPLDTTEQIRWFLWNLGHGQIP